MKLTTYFYQVSRLIMSEAISLHSTLPVGLRGVGRGNFRLSFIARASTHFWQTVTPVTAGWFAGRRRANKNKCYTYS